MSRLIATTQREFVTKPKALVLWILVLPVFLLVIIDNPISVNFGGIRSNVPELLSAVAFAWIWISPKLKKSALWPGFMFLVIISFMPLAAGAFKFETERVVRDFSQVIYISFFAVGYYCYKNRLFSVNTLIKSVQYTSLIMVSLFLLDLWMLRSGFAAGYELNLRILVAFSIVFTFAGLIHMNGVPRVNFVPGFISLALLLMFVGQVRTRALYLMVALGILLLVSVHLFSKRSPRNLSRLFLVALLVLLIISTLLINVSGAADLLLGNFLTRISSLTQESYQSDITIAIRLKSWSLAYGEFLNNPLFGQGFGRYLLLDPTARGHIAEYPVAMIHNSFLAILYSGGLLYLLGYLAFFYKVLTAPGSVDFAAQFSQNGLRLVTFSFSVGLIVYASFGTTFFDFQTIPIWFLIGFLSGDTPAADDRGLVASQPSSTDPGRPITPSQDMAVS